MQLVFIMSGAVSQLQKLSLYNEQILDVFIL